MSKKVKRSLRIEVNKTDNITQIILGYITYHAGKLWNEANFLVKNKLAKPNIFDLYNKLKDTSIHKNSLPHRHRPVIYEKRSIKLCNNSNRRRKNKLYSRWERNTKHIKRIV